MQRCARSPQARELNMIGWLHVTGYQENRNHRTLISLVPRIRVDGKGVGHTR